MTPQPAFSRLSRRSRSCVGKGVVACNAAMRLGLHSLAQQGTCQVCLTRHMCEGSLPTCVSLHLILFAAGGAAAKRGGGPHLPQIVSFVVNCIISKACC